MGNEMGNSNTSGLREEHNIAQDISPQEIATANDFKGQNHVAPAAEDKDSQGKENGFASGEVGREAHSVDDSKRYSKELEEDNMRTEGKKSLQEAAGTDDVKGQNHEVPAHDDAYKNEKETGLASMNLEGVAETHNDNQKQDKKEEDGHMIPEAKEKSLEEAAYANEAKGTDRLVPAAKDETQLISTESDQIGMASPHIDSQAQDEKGNNSTSIEVKEKSLEEAASQDEVIAQAEADLVPAPADESTQRAETEMISTEPDQIGVASPHIDDRAQDEKGNNSTNIEVTEQEAACQDEVMAEAEADLVPASEDENTHGVETGLVSNETDEKAYDGLDNQKEDEKEGEDININDDAKEKSSQEAAITDDVEKHDHPIPAVEDKSTRGNGTGLVSGNPEGTADIHVDNPKEGKKEEDKTNDETWDQTPTEDAHADDIEDKSLMIPAAEGEDCDKMEAEAELACGGDSMLVGDTLDNRTLEGQEQGTSGLRPQSESMKVEVKPSDEVSEVREMQLASSTKNLEDHEMHQGFNLEENLPETSHHSENQNPMMREDEGAINLVPDAESSTSHHLIHQEPAVIEPEQYKLAEIDTEQLVQVCNGPQKSENMIIPSSSCPDQENGFISDSRISTDMVESACVDPSTEVEKEKVYVLVEEMAAKEVSNEEKCGLNHGDEDGNNLTKITTTDFPNGLGAKSNGELPGKMNSGENDPAESQVEVILSDETQNIQLEVLKSEDEGMGLRHKAILVMEEPENEDSKQSNCQIHSVEESTEQSNGKGSEDRSKAHEPNSSPPQFMMTGQESEESRFLLDTSCDRKSSKSCQLEEAKIVENGNHVDVSFDYQNEATEEQQKDSQNEVHLVIYPAVISADISLTDPKCEEEESEEKEIVKEIVGKIEDLNPTSRRESGEQSISHSYPIEQAEASLKPCLDLQALPEIQQQENDIQAKMVQNSNESKVEMKQETCGEFSPPTSGSSFVDKSLTEKNVISTVELAGEKPLLDLSESPKATSMAMAETKLPERQSSEQCPMGETFAMANGDHHQQESVGRLSTESNPDNVNIHAQMRKSPSFDLDLRIDAKAEESDQTPLLYQDKTTIDSFSGQADVTLGKVTVVNTEDNKTSSPYEAVPVKEKVVTLEQSDSEKSNTAFLGFLKEEEEEEAQLLITPDKQDKHSAPKVATKVSTKEVPSASPKGKEKRKTRTSLFGTCMCCATVIN